MTESNEMEYITRIADNELDKRAEAFNAICIVGPKGCGKTRTATERCKTIIEFQDEERREGYLSVAETSPSLLLKREKPILFDEWQDAPKIWGAVRKDCDDNPGSTGSYFLTGSSSKKGSVPHTGTGRISELAMYPMTLFETGDSNGKVSLTSLVADDSYDIDGMRSDLGIEQLIFAACRGGWPRCLEISKPEAKLEIARDYARQIYRKDISAIDDIQRNPELARTILWSYARNMATMAKGTSLLADVQANIGVSKATFLDYVGALKRLYVIEDVDAWAPQIRSRTAIRSAKKHVFVDPSIAIAVLGLSPEYFYTDFDLFGHVFENLVIRDLLAFAAVHDARVFHYSDDYGLEVDAIYQLGDGRYALIEVKRGTSAILEAEKNLLKFKELIAAHNRKALGNAAHPGVTYREPSQCIVICANAEMAYTTSRGVKVVPVGCLRD